MDLNRAGRRTTDRLSTKPLINDGTILLPIPSNLQDTNNVQYDSSTLNGLQAAGWSSRGEYEGLSRFKYNEY